MNSVASASPGSDFHAIHTQCISSKKCKKEKTQTKLLFLLVLVRRKENNSKLRQYREFRLSMVLGRKKKNMVVTHILERGL
jgi:hypothetical protein